MCRSCCVAVHWVEGVLYSIWRCLSCLIVQFCFGFGDANADLNIDPYSGWMSGILDTLANARAFASRVTFFHTGLVTTEGVRPALFIPNTASFTVLFCASTLVVTSAAVECSFPPRMEGGDGPPQHWPEPCAGAIWIHRGSS